MKQFFCLLAALALLTGAAHARLNVVASLPDFASLAEDIGGDKVKVTSLAKGTEDAHFVDAKPSFIRVLNQADALIEGGAELEQGWLPPLVLNARNPRILPNAPGHIVLARGLKLLDVPTKLDRSQGDVHAAGNPHFNLDPGNFQAMAATIAEAFARLDAANAPHYAANLKRFNERLAGRLVEWDKLAVPLRGVKVITYHKSFDYLAARFGLEVFGQIEPKPGIEPTPTHINTLIPQAKSAGVKLVLMEPNRARKTPQFVADSIGARLVVCPGLVGGAPEAKSCFELIEFDLRALLKGLQP
ncbi:MAG: ABC transporter substrate binding component [Limisphaerales bacterium]|nr:MAG: ABC transporter substrate binding component [Limisphaerales bacterium]KAG0507386.1 MAG: ABC transporter substrate binding component [Limisphaerales bacterium]TXT50730.1 MAG: ABC transporter substrate binding component [Limisphaerales bacterium]